MMSNSIKTPLFTPIDLKEHLDLYAVGQDEYKKRLAMKIDGFVNSAESYNGSLLCMGPSGTGKSHIFSSLKKFEPLANTTNIFMYDVSGITPAAFNGNGVEHILLTYRKECSNPLGRKGIIFLDEIDKIISMPNRGGDGDDMNIHVMSQMLSLLDPNQTIQGIPMKNLLFVMGGVFTEYYLMKEKKERKIGFSENQNDNLFSECSIRDDLIKLGATREFVGRIESIVQLENLTRREMKAIILHPEKGIIPVLKRRFAQYGLDLMFTPGAIEKILDLVISENLGARGCKSVIDTIVGTTDFYMLENHIKAVTFHEDVMAGKAPYYDKRMGVRK